MVIGAFACSLQIVSTSGIEPAGKGMHSIFPTYIVLRLAHPFHLSQTDFAPFKLVYIDLIFMFVF